MLTSSAWSALDVNPEGARGGDEINISGYDSSRFHALVVAIDDYAEWPDLSCAKNDGRAVAATLKNDFHFGDVKLLENESATREAILTALDSYMSLGDSESLLIYYAGHGWMDPKTKTGYWIPVEARRGKKFDYVANSQMVEDYFKKYKVKHLLVIADSCFSGTLLRGMAVSDPEKKFDLPVGFNKPSRWVMTSGDLAPVPDDAGSGHSPFASRILQYLKYSDSAAFGVQDLYVYVRKNLEGESIAQPMKTPAHMPGGEFVFCRKPGAVGQGAIDTASGLRTSLEDVQMIGQGTFNKDNREYMMEPGGMFSKAVFKDFPDGRFASKSHGRVYDRHLNRTWWMYSADQGYKWKRARQLLKEETKGAFRLPSEKELLSLVTRSKTKNEWARINTDVFRENTRTVRFWTNNRGFGDAVCVDFIQGKAEDTARDERCGLLAISSDTESE